MFASLKRARLKHTWQKMKKSLSIGFKILKTVDYKKNKIIVLRKNICNVVIYQYSKFRASRPTLEYPNFG